MAQTPAVSVLMPFLDNGDRTRRRQFEQSLQSILAQRFRNFEVVMAISGKQDFASRLAGKSKKIRCFFSPVAGVSSARNLCIAKARGEYACWQDADDISLPERLAVQISYLESNPKVGLVGSSMRLIGKNGREMGVLGAFETDEEIRKNLISFPYIFQPTVCARRKLLLKVGGYRNVLSEDYDLWVRLAKITKFYNIRKPLVKYRVLSGISTGNRLARFFSSLQVRWRIVTELGIMPTAGDFAVVGLQFAAVFYPVSAGGGAYSKLRSMLYGAMHPRLAGD